MVKHRLHVCLCLRPELVLASRSQPLSRRRPDTRVWPPAAAQCSAHQPRRWVQPGSAPREMQAATSAYRPSCAAQYSCSLISSLMTVVQQFYPSDIALGSKKKSRTKIYKEVIQNNHKCFFTLEGMNAQVANTGTDLHAASLLLAPHNHYW